MVVALALILAALFGAGDQYLGSFAMHPWMTDVSLLSAPWLALAFVAGSTQREPKRAAVLGIGCTFSALIGYGLMTLSPVENAHIGTVAVAGFIRSSERVFIGGLLTGPLFGWFGYRWRVHRAWLGALATAAALCFEPLARSLAGDAIRSSTVLLTEVAVGIAIAAYVAVRMLMRPESARHA
jgi:ABC-type transport system involved in multi-copper enzyme maturation permease subunit